MEKISRKARRSAKRAGRKTRRVQRRSKQAAWENEAIPYSSAYGDISPRTGYEWQPSPFIVEPDPADSKAMRKYRRAQRRAKARDASKQVGAWFRNLPLRYSFMAYVLLFLLMGVLLCVVAVVGLENAREEILLAYGDTAGAPIEYYYLAGDQVLIQIMDGSTVFAPITPGDRAAYAILSALMFLSIPGISLGCIFLAGILFYQYKLRKPITELEAASVRIGENNLDFHIRYQSRDELGRLCVSFESMRSALEKNNQEMWRQMEERRRLNAAFSHDLRTPLTVLRGHTELLQTYIPQGRISPEKTLETLGTMAGQISRLERYVEAMQSVQRLTDWEVHREFVERDAFLRELQETAMLLCRAHAIHFTEASDGGKLKIDPNLVMQVYENLLANAARHAKKELWVEFLHAETLFCIRVSDDGPGFTEEGLQMAAQPFYRAEDNKRGGQFGLGLYICAVLCEQHGGKLELANRPEGGARILASFSEKE